jgi:hypothetical protein
MFPLFLFGVWAVVVLMPVLEKRAKNQPGGVSILPGFPVMPLMAWGLAALLDWVYPKLGYYAIGGLHCILMIVALVYTVKYVYQIKRRA